MQRTAAALWKKKDPQELKAKLKHAMSNEFPSIVRQGSLTKLPQKPMLFAKQSDDKKLSIAE